MTDPADLLRPLLNRASPPLAALQARVTHRRRRRRLRAAVATMAVTIAVVVIAASLSGESGRHVTKVRVGRPPEGSLVSISLPATASEAFSSISASSGDLLLTGVLQAVGSTPVCDYASLDPESLQLGQVHTAACDDPVASGQTASLVTGPDYNTNPGPSATARIATLDTATGKVSDGPVVFTYLDASDTRPLTAYADGLMWVYDEATNHGSEVLQVSAATGAVVDTIAMPQMDRPILAANEAGLWIGDSLDGNGPGINTLYRVAPGARAPVVVIAGSRVVTWLQADPRHVWAGVASVPVTTQTIWSFDGTGSTPAFRAPLAGTDDTVIGDAKEGLWTVRWTAPSPARSPSPEPQRVLQIKPTNGSQSIITTLPPFPVSYTTGLSQGQAAVLDGYLYILEPPYRPGVAYPQLIRVSAPSP